MAQLSRTWWGQRFIQALEQITDPGRLSRGRSYANGQKMIRFEIKGSSVTAQVRGSVNPYFGVYTEPLYTTEIEMQPLSQDKWSAAIAYIASKASFVSKLLMNEMPDNIEAAFSQLNLHLLPRSCSDFKTNCSCPDWGNPCKHVAGVYYLVAAELDRDPFLLFELRGLDRQTLREELAKSPLGLALVAELDAQGSQALQQSTSYYTRAETVSPGPDIPLKDFWLGTKRLPDTIHPPHQVPVSAVLVKKQGDFPPFWDKEESFIAVMEEFYERVKTKMSDVL
ncbi:SWF/SNF family helicase [uncultured Synechococcales cyanobacterium]|uniref:SWF/SNF family helicase n=1 Tax=uncultured Synechococcales cyanobacterium TaxID=1936017 RepID=A0A6J4VYD8_9CYAN|nr:SWF/SNF family helicase [uncultured Synechococcales cyanobacterium]